MTVSLIIPAYNEALRLAPFLESLVAHRATHADALNEVIVVDDGSTDGTAAVAESFADRLPLKLIRHARNRGKGAAVRTGVFAATGEGIVFMDADGATPATELPKMTHALLTADVAIGNRWLPGAHTVRRSWQRRLAGWVYRQYMRLFGLAATDTMCGCKAYRRAVARDLFEHLTDERWLFDTEVTFKAVRRGFRVVNIPIHWEAKAGSKLSAMTMVRCALAIWPLVRKVRANERRHLKHALTE